MQAICKYLLAVLCLLPLFSFAGKPAGEKSFYMVREGKACGIIVWRSGNNYAAEAAKELQYAFKKISGADVPLLPAVPDNYTGNMIYVGYPQKAPAGLKSPSYLPPEGYLLKTIGKTLYLFGDDKLLSKKWNIHRDGTFASVQYLLDEYFGCRFFMAGKNGELLFNRYRTQVL